MPEYKAEHTLTERAAILAQLAFTEFANGVLDGTHPDTWRENAAFMIADALDQYANADVASPASVTGAF